MLKVSPELFPSTELLTKTCSVASVTLGLPFAIEPVKVAEPIVSVTVDEVLVALAERIS
jgi:hypothetical protein